MPPSFLVLTDCARVREKGENFVVTTDFTDHTELVASIIDGETRNFIVIWEGGSGVSQDKNFQHRRMNNSL